MAIVTQLNSVSSENNQSIYCAEALDNVSQGPTPRYECYVTAWCISKVGTSISSVFLGNYTDKTLSEAYTPVNPVEDCDAGDELNLSEPLEFCDSNNHNFYGLMNLSVPELVYAFDADGEYEPIGPYTAGHCDVSANAIESSLAEIGCTRNALGVVDGKVMMCKTVNEVTGTESFELKRVDLATGVVATYVGPIEDCNIVEERLITINLC